MGSIFDIIYCAAALLILAIGVFALVNNYANKIGWSFFLGIICTFGWMFTLYWGYWFIDSQSWQNALITFRFSYAFSLLAMSFMTVFFYYFPRVTYRATKSIKLIFVFLAVSLLITCCCLKVL